MKKKKIQKIKMGIVFIGLPLITLNTFFYHDIDIRKMIGALSPLVQGLETPLINAVRSDIVLL